jgi:SNF2 family DNA or RNA helicase
VNVRADVVDRAGELWLELHGGDPKGNDPLHRMVSDWAGWRRCQLIGEHMGMVASRYQARAWLAALQPLLASKLTIAWTPAGRAWADQQLELARRRDAALASRPTAADIVRWRAAAGGRDPMPHQAQMLEALTETGGQVGLRDDMGLGKTTTALLYWSDSQRRRALVICPKSVKLNWLEEVQAVFALRGAERELGKPLVYLIDGTPAQRANVIGYMRAAIAENAQAIAIVNYDLLRSMNELAWMTLEQWCGNQFVVCDEFHYCKDLDSKRAKSVQALMQRAAIRVGLTGTPVRNTIEDLFGLCELLRPGTWVSYHKFAERHLVTSKVPVTPGSKRTREIVRGGKNLEELNRIVNTMWVGRKKEEVLTLPPLMRSKPKLELDGLHLDVYEAMKKFARVELEKLMAPKDAFLNAANTALEPGQPESGPGVAWGEVSMFHPLARSGVEAAMRCEMIAQGFLSGLPELYAEQVAPMIAGKAERIEGYPNAFVFPDSPKMAWLLDTVESALAERPVVVFSRFNAPLLWLSKRLESTTMLIGSMDAVSRHESITAFREGRHRIMLCQVKLAEGFNLTNASDVVFLGRDWAPAINAQAEARCHRIGTTGTVNVQIPIVHNSVERFIEKKLAAKDADAQQALKTVTLRELLEAL